MTGPEALATAEVVAKISTATGRPIDCIEVPETLAGDGMLAQGMSLPLAEAVLELMALIREGYGSGTMTTVGEVLGRKGRTFDAWLQEHVMAFR